MDWASLRPILSCPDAINWMLDSVSSSKCLIAPTCYVTFCPNLLFFSLSHCLRIISIRTGDSSQNYFPERGMIDIGFARKHNISHVTDIRFARKHNIYHVTALKTKHLKC